MGHAEHEILLRLALASQPSFELSFLISTKILFTAVLESF